MIGHFMRALITPGVILLACLTAGRPAAQTPPATTLLDRYARGEFDAVVAALEECKDVNDILNDLKRGGQAWIAAGGPADVARRELAGATFALEAARAGEWKDWKQVQHAPAPSQPNLIYWHGPPKLIDWGSAIFRKDATPRPIELWWQLAALAVAERAEDPEFLLGSPFEARAKRSDEFEYLNAMSKRFPHEPRFALAQGIALEWTTWPERPRGGRPIGPGTRNAIQVFEGLQKDEAVGAEASVRLGSLRLRSGAVDVALKLFDHVETVTRDPYLIYLARYLKGQALEKGNQAPEAETAYRGALAAVPQAQSASLALAALLFTRNARAESAAIIDANLSARPQPLDPWRGYADADDRFWPLLVARLRAEIHR